MVLVAVLANTKSATTTIYRACDGYTIRRRIIMNLSDYLVTNLVSKNFLIDSDSMLSFFPEMKQTSKENLVEVA